MDVEGSHGADYLHEVLFLVPSEALLQVDHEVVISDLGASLHGVHSTLEVFLEHAEDIIFLFEFRANSVIDGLGKGLIHRVGQLDHDHFRTKVVFHVDLTNQHFVQISLNVLIIDSTWAIQSNE